MNSVKDDEDERDDGVWQCGLQYHCRNAGVRPTVLLPNGRFYLMTHMKKAEDQQKSEKDIDSHREREEWKGKVEYPIRP